MPTITFQHIKKHLILAGLAGFACIVLFVELLPDKPQAGYTLAFAFLMAFWWVTETLPTGVTALIPVAAFPLMGILDGDEVSKCYFNGTIFLYVGGFLMAFAMERWNLHKRIALSVLSLAGIRPAFILAGFMFSAGFLSMWMSNTATTMLMIPIVLSILGTFSSLAGEDTAKRFAKGLLLGVAYSSSIGGMATLIGTPPNLVFLEVYNSSFPAATEVSFANWMAFALPFSLLMLVVCWGLIFNLHLRNLPHLNMDNSTFKNMKAALGAKSPEEKLVIVLFALMALSWIFRADIDTGAFTIPGWSGLLKNPDYVNDGNIAIFYAVLLFAIPSKTRKGERLMNWKTATKLPWEIVLLFGGGFALAKAFTVSGLSGWIGSEMESFSGLHPLLMVFFISLVVSFLTELTSNVATTQMLLPVLAAISAGLSLPPLLLMVPATLAASHAFMLPVATPPNAIVFGSGHLHIRDMVRTGFWLNMTGVVVISLLTWYWGSYVWGF